MNGGAPRCPKCGGLSTNPNDQQCRFCGAALNAYGAPQSFAPSPQAYGQPPQGYAPPQGYGAPQPQHGYAAPPQGYAAPQPQHGYGAPQPQQGYAAPPAPYGAPAPFGAPNPYGAPGPYPMVPVQRFGGGYGQQINRGPFGSGWSSFLWFRLAIAAIAISLSLVGACISAIAN
jgi:hypothetical protein